MNEVRKKEWHNLLGIGCLLGLCFLISTIIFPSWSEHGKQEYHVLHWHKVERAGLNIYSFDIEDRETGEVSLSRELSRERGFRLIKTDGETTYVIRSYTYNLFYLIPIPYYEYELHVNNMQQFLEW